MIITLTALAFQMAAVTPTDSAAHILNRLGFGPTPGQVEQVARVGVLRWIERQLEPRRSRPAWERSFAVLDRPTSELVAMVRAEQRDRVARARDSMPPARPPLDSTGSRRMQGPPSGFRRLAVEYQQLTVARAVRSEDQLLEVMTDFWFNHFNVFAGKPPVRPYLRDYVEETIRPHALGRFEDLLLATASSPAMLLYLDNAASVAPGSRPPGLDRVGRRRGLRGRGPRPERRGPLPDSLRRMIEARLPTGTNENYARELLELHTLGVDGGYTQQDVAEVARIFTGWSVARFGDGGFQFNAWAHDRGEKTVLGTRFHDAGQDEGRALLHQLAQHPATIHHVSAKLCARFVSDAAPDGCVDAAAAAWRASDGDVRAILRAIVHSADFWASRNAKVKSPLEFVVSALRATGAAIDEEPGSAGAIARLGQPLFLQSAPTGYPESEEAWMSSAALFNRMNLAMGLAADRLPGVSLDLSSLLPDGSDRETLIAALDRLILAGGMSENTRETIRRETADLDPAAARVFALGLALGSPEFQRQ